MKKYSLYEVFKDNGFFLNEAVDFYSDKNKTISVYHLTGKKGTLNTEVDTTVKSIAGDLDTPGNEFQPGSGDLYGKGLYTCYKLNKRIVYIYGNTLLEFKIPVKNFLVFVDDEAQAIHGDNAPLDKQLYSILDRKGIDYKTNPEFSSVIEEFANYLQSTYETRIKGTSTDKKNRTGPACYDTLVKFSTLTRNKIKLKHLVDGVMLYGNTDGPVCVIFNTQMAAINRVGKVIGKDVEIFERPSQIGINDFDNKTFNQIRAYSAKRGKGQKEWRAHQKKLIDVANNEISEYTSDDVDLDKEKLKSILESSYEEAMSRVEKDLLSKSIATLPELDYTQLGQLTDEDFVKALRYAKGYGKIIANDFDITKYITSSFNFSAQLEEFCKEKAGPRFALEWIRECIDALNQWEMYDEIPSLEELQSKIQKSLVVSHVPEEIKTCEDLAKSALEVIKYKKLIYEFIEGSRDDVVTEFLDWITQDNREKLEEIFSKPKVNTGFVKLADSEKQKVVDAVINHYNEIMDQHKKAAYEDYPQILQQKLSQEYEQLKTEMPQEAIFDEVLSHYHDSLASVGVDFEKDLDLTIEQLDECQNIKYHGEIFEAQVGPSFSYLEGYNVDETLCKLATYCKGDLTTFMYFDSSVVFSNVMEEVYNQLEKGYMGDRVFYHNAQCEMGSDHLITGDVDIRDILMSLSEKKYYRSLLIHSKNKIYSNLTQVRFSPDIK